MLKCQGVLLLTRDSIGIAKGECAMATKLLPVGSEFQVNQATQDTTGIANIQTNPDVVSLADGRFVAVYDSFFDSGGVDIDVLAHFVNANGTLSGTTLGPATQGGIQELPAVAARGDGGFTTVWQDFG